MSLIRVIKYFLMQIAAFIFWLFGGIYIIKFLLRKKPNYIVFNYHNFSKYNNYGIKRGNMLETGYIENFEKQIEFLKRHFNFCYPEEFFEGEPKYGRNGLITFDDGYKDNFDIAFPILKKRKIPCVFFITTQFTKEDDFLLHDKVRFLVQQNLLSQKFSLIPTHMYQGKNNYNEKDIVFINQTFYKHKPKKRLMMNISEVREIADQGYKIGNHTHNHLELSFYSKELQLNSIAKSNNVIESITQVPVNYLAYPNGLYNNDTFNVLEKLNIKYGFTIFGGANNKNDSLKELKRIGVNASDSINFMVFKLFIYLTYKKGKIS